MSVVVLSKYQGKSTYTFSTERLRISAFHSPARWLYPLKPGREWKVEDVRQKTYTLIYPDPLSNRTFQFWSFWKLFLCHNIIFCHKFWIGAKFEFYHAFPIFQIASYKWQLLHNFYKCKLRFCCSKLVRLLPISIFTLVQSLQQMFINYSNK